MKELEKLIENFFSKKENFLSGEELKEYIEKQFLLEAKATFDIKEISKSKYYSGWIERIKRREPFLILHNDGSKEEVVIDPKFAETLSTLGFDLNSLRDFFMPAPSRTYAKVIPAESGNKYSLTQFAKETFTQRSASAEDAKEGMAAYFYGVLSSNKGKKEISNLVTALTTDKAPKISLPLEIDVDNIKIGQITSFILDQIKRANSHTFDAASNNLLLNAVSCALGMNSLINASKNVVIDRADLFKRYKRAASKITRGNENKWCPADFFIYEKGMAGELEKIAAEAEASNTLVTLSVEKEMDRVGLNEAFSDNNKHRIVAVSLKEKDAQYGKALGLAEHASAVLNRSDIKVITVDKSTKDLIKSIDSKTVVVSDAMIKSVAAELEKYKKLSLDFMNNMGIKNVRMVEDAPNVAEGYDVLKEISLLLEAGFKDFREFVLFRKPITDKISKGEEIKLIDGTTVQISKDVLSNLEAHGHDSTMLSRLYGGMNKGLPTTSGDLVSIRQLDKASFGAPPSLPAKEPAQAMPASPVPPPAPSPAPTATAQPTDAKQENEQLYLYDKLIKKTECYKYLYSYITQFSSIKQINSALASYENPLLALTAYAVGLGGFNPTFYKVQGNTTGAVADITKFEGQEKLLMSSKSATLIDEPNFAGIKFFYVVNMGGKGKGEKLYETQLNFRFKGDAQMTIEVYKFKEK